MWLLSLACAPKSPALEPATVLRSPGSELVVSGPVGSRVSTLPADLVLFYGGEQGGRLGTCGCPDRPRGGLARQLAYINASRQANPGQADLVLNGGYWLEDPADFEGRPVPSIQAANLAMAQGLGQVGVDAANIGYVDIPGLLELPSVPDWAVSANVQGLDRQPGVVLQAGELTVGVVGMTSFGYTLASAGDVQVGNPRQSALNALRDLEDQVDVLVLLSYRSSDAAADLAREVDALDVVIDTDLHRGHFSPERVNNAVWVRTHYQTMRLGELRVLVDETGQVEVVVDRKIDLDDQIGEDPALSALIATAQAEIDALAAEQGPMLLPGGH